MRMITALLVLPLLGCELIVGIEDPILPDSGSDSHSACTSQCMGDELVTCSGDTPQRSTCELGCSAEGTPHCRQVIPSNGALLSDLDKTTGNLVMTEENPGRIAYEINTDTGKIRRGDYESRGAGSETIRPATDGLDRTTGTFFRRINDTISVLAVDSLTIQTKTNKTVELYGIGDRALIILSRHDVTINGEINFIGGCDSGLNPGRCGGPGGGEGGDGNFVATGCAPGKAGSGFGGSSDASAATGGGGGGFGQAGATGGQGTGPNPNPGGSGGAPSDECPAPELVPLTGGSGGGAGSAGVGIEGGGGGGAIQIISLSRIAIGELSYAAINANGGGGAGSLNFGGGGGGSGGAILLEAPVVVIAEGGSLNAVGGGGGSGTSGRGGLGYLGGPGTGTDESIGRGGNGGWPAKPPSKGAGIVNGSGGGGGGGGIVRINATTVRIDKEDAVAASYSQGEFPIK